MRTHSLTLLACSCSPVRCSRNQVRQERLQGSIPPAAAHLQQCHDLRGLQSQAAHRLRSSERFRAHTQKHQRCFLGGFLTFRPAGISVSSLSDGLFVLHVPGDDNKQKVKQQFFLHESVGLVGEDSRGLLGEDSQGLLVSSQGDVILQSDHVIETLTKIAICADKINNININQGR